MNAFEAQLHYPFGDQLPQPGSTLEVAPGVRWVRMRLPFVLDHINLWLLRDEVDGQSGWTVVDCCIHHDEAKEQWETIFKNELQGLPILRVIVTHMHPDHMGLAAWLCERWNAPLWISATDYQTARSLTQSKIDMGGETVTSFFASHGLSDPLVLAQLKSRQNYYASMVPKVPSQFHRLMDRQWIDIGIPNERYRWRCISGFGHAPEHISLYCEQTKVLIGGDMMLPRISTNVSVFEVEPESNPLMLFLQSIDRLKSLDARTLTLPSHGKPFTGLHTRIGQLQAHHRDRMAEVFDACQTTWTCAADILPIMFKRQLDPHQTTFAMGEALAHLHHGWYAGKLERVCDSAGVYRFHALGDER